MLNPLVFRRHYQVVQLVRNVLTVAVVERLLLEIVEHWNGWSGLYPKDKCTALLDGNGVVIS